MLTCTSCGRESPEDFRFCPICGSQLGDVTAGREERKVVTVIFVDVVGFTSRSERLDPEDVRATLSPYYARVRSELERYGGTVEKFIGDAVMAVFGAPVAHEDDPERAVRAALAVQDAVRDLNESDPALDLHVRVGVDTGEAIVALDARPMEGEGMVAGDVVNTAARLQSAAPVDGILVGEQTYRATSRVIHYRTTAPIEAKGKSGPIVVWEATGAIASFGVDVAHRMETPLVGRGRELAMLVDALGRAREDGVTQLVTLVGEPGIGKSRLVFELGATIDQDAELVTWRQGRCLPYGDGVSLWALSEMVKAQAGILESDDEATAREKLAGVVRDVLPGDEQAPWVERHLRSLVGLGKGALVRGSPADDGFPAWGRFLEALASHGPTVLIFEDLHWADDRLLDFVDHLVDWTTGVPLLIVGTARPELLSRRSDWGGGKSNAVTVTLSPLSDEETGRLIEQLVDGKAITEERRATLVARAGGNPLYAEEFARLAADLADAERSSELPLPETVQGIIAARIDALPALDKTVLQDAAVIGKVFWPGAVSTLGGAERSEIDRCLHELERRRFVRRERRSSVGAETEFAFLHGLVRDVAYGQTARAVRADKHRRVAGWLEALGVDRGEDRAELLAHHYREALALARAAGLDASTLEAPARWAMRAAGDRASALGSLAAASRFYTEAAAAWPADDPDRPYVLMRAGLTRWQHEGSGEDLLEEARDALLAAGDRPAAAEAETWLADQAWTAGRGQDALERIGSALSLVRGAEPSRSTAWVLAQVARFHMFADRSREAIDIGQQALSMATELGIPDLRASALATIGSASPLDDGIAQLEAGIAIAEEAHAPWEIIRGYTNLAVTHWGLGDLRQAAALVQRAITIIGRYDVSPVHVWPRFFIPGFQYQTGEWDSAIGSAEALLTEIEEGPGHQMEASLRRLIARIRLARGDVEGAMADSTRSLAVARAIMDPQDLHPGLGAHAWLALLAGRRDEASAAVDELIEALDVMTPSAVWTYWFLDAAVVLEAVGRGAEAIRLADLAPASRWVDAGRAWAEGDPGAAADVLHEMGSLPDEALARLMHGERLAAQGHRRQAEEELERALTFHRSVGATHFIDLAEHLLTASA